MFSEAFRLDNILNACEKIWYFLKVNILFIIFNLPILLFLLFVGFGQIRTYLPLFMLCAVFFGPAISAVFFCMNRLLHKYDTGAFRDFMKSYFDSLGRKFSISFIHMFFTLVFWTNIEFFTKDMKIFPLSLLFVIAFVLAVLITPNLYLLTSRYEMSIKDTFIGAITITVTRPLLTLSNFIIFTFVLMLFEIKAGTFVLFISSIYGFLIVFMNQKVFKELDECSKEKES